MRQPKKIPEALQSCCRMNSCLAKGKYCPAECVEMYSDTEYLVYTISRVYILLMILYTEMFTAYGWYETKRERERERERVVCMCVQVR